MQNSILVKAYPNDIILEKKYFQEKEMDYYQFTLGNYFIRMTKNSLIKIKNIMPMLELKSIIMEPQIGIVKEVINYIYKIYEEEDLKKQIFTNDRMEVVKYELIYLHGEYLSDFFKYLKKRHLTKVFV